MREPAAREQARWGRQLGRRRPMARRSMPRFRPAGRADRRRFVAPEAWPRPPAPRAGWWPEIGRGLGASGLVHLLLAAIIVLASLYRPSQQAPEQLPPPAIEMVFENSGAPDRPSEPDAEPAPQVNIPPPGAVPSVPSPPVPQQLPRPPPTAPPPPQLAAPQVQPPPEPPRPPAPPRPQLAEAVPELPPPPPPPPAPPQPQQAQPRVTPPPAPPQPNPRPNRLPGPYIPDAYAALNRPPTPASPTQRPGQPRRGLDLSMPSLMAPPGRNSAEPQAEIRGANVGPDWRNAFRRWLDEHLRYPREAAEAGEDGTVRVRIISEPNGTVRSVALTGASRSFWLNTRTQHPFRGARIPAFPPGSDPNGVTIDLTVNYVLIRR